MFRWLFESNVEREKRQLLREEEKYRRILAKREAQLVRVKQVTLASGEVVEHRIYG